MIIPFELNGDKVFIDSNPGERLVHILRRRFNLLSAKEGCLSGRCGSCMVLMNDSPVPSCIMPIFQVRNTSITTLESFCKTDDYQDIINAFEGAGVNMCGFCNAGKIFIAHTILLANLRPLKEEIREMFSGNMCRCTNIEDLITGVKNAGANRRKRQNVK